MSTYTTCYNLKLSVICDLFQVPLSNLEDSSENFPARETCTALLKPVHLLL